jgi:hypothetical protein
MQPELKEQLEASAQQAGRSLNAEIVARLENSFSTPDHAILLAAFDRLNTALAQSEMETVGERAQAANLAIRLRAVCELLLPLVDDPKFQAEIKEYIAEANPFIHGASKIEADMKKVIDKLAASISKRGSGLKGKSN